MDYRVVFSALAERDLEEIVRFLARKNRMAAERLGNALVDDALSLAALPHRGLAIKRRPGWRRILHQPWFLIFYRIEEDQRLVEVVRFWDSRKDPQSLWQDA
ncbi:MAG: type II toxin-antitoxin system RelE/ParE family toxin [Opitutaceae bacterium]|jgi:plasmid stabilization system protein ParE|nr:type II toxin-antitoxin system RelE/ParE family toxin [Opitutaceae bacterium]